MGMSRLNQYLYSKRGRWHYTRCVPSEVAHLDRRGTIRVGLKTDSLDVARHRRDAMMLADNEYWALLQKNERNGASSIPLLSRYQAAKKRRLPNRPFFYLISNIASMPSGQPARAPEERRQARLTVPIIDDNPLMRCKQRCSLYQSSH